MLPAEAARWYIRHKYKVVPLPYRTKAPVIEGWPTLDINETNLELYFNGDPMNIGVRLGEEGLTDIDLDTPEALLAWPEFALPTSVIFGRAGKPESHYFYLCQPAPRTIRFLDPLPPAGVGACLMEMRALKSDGTIGLQTVVPPSTHAETGEVISFAHGAAGPPGLAAPELLTRAARHTAASVLLGRHAPAEGRRHDFFLALAGALARAKWVLADAARVLRAIYRILWGPGAELFKAEKEAESTFQHFEDRHETTGLPHLESVLDRRVLAKALDWLGITKGPAAPKTKAQPKVHPMSEVLATDTPPPELLVENVLPRHGATLLSGMQKSGKSVFAMQTAIAVATGRALFDNYRIRAPGSVLLLEQDDPDGIASVKQILLAAHVPRDAPFHFVAKQDCFYIGSEMVSWLESQIREHHLVLVILDSYTALRAAHPPGVDFVKHENLEMTLLDELGKRTHCLILLLHHDRKGSAGLDWSSKAGGTYAMTMATESQIQVCRYPELSIGARERHVRLQGRHLESHEMTLRFDPEVMSYELVLEGPGAGLYPLILQLKAEFGTQAFNAKLLVETTGVSRATAFRQIAALFRGQVLRKTGASGDYQLIPFEPGKNS